MSRPHELYDRWQRAGAGRGRRASAPARFRPVGYRAGGPSPLPGPNPASGPGAQPGPSPAPTPNPRPGPVPVAPALPGGSDGLNLGAVLSGGIAELTGIGQVLLGAGFLAVALLLLLGETSAGGQLARDTRRAVVGAGRLALTKRA